MTLTRSTAPVFSQHARSKYDRRVYPLGLEGFNADASTVQQQDTIAKVSATGIGLAAGLAAIPVVGPLAALAAGIFSIFNKPAKVLTEQQVVGAITPAVMNDLQNQGLYLPPGQESQYVDAVLKGQTPQPQANMLVPLGLGAAAILVLVL
jgi:hypothetical protein